MKMSPDDKILPTLFAGFIVAAAIGVVFLLRLAFGSPVEAEQPPPAEDFHSRGQYIPVAANIERDRSVDFYLINTVTGDVWAYSCAPRKRECAAWKMEITESEK